MMYNFNHLYYFYMTVKSGGVTVAASHLFISQPSLSGQLKTLEEFLQTKLFKKVGRKNVLTREGSVIYGYCRQMFEVSEEMHESINEKIPYASRRIYIGVSNEIANSFVVEVISHFLSKYSGAIRPKVVMVSGGHEKLSEQLRFKELDVVVSPFSMVHPDLDNLQHIDVPVNLICSLDKKNSIKNKTLSIDAALKAVTDDEIGQWVLPSQGFKLRAEINNFFELNSLKGRIVFESDVMESLTRSVVDGIGISFLPLIYVPKEIKNKLLYSLGPREGYWRHRIWLGGHSQTKDDQLVSSLALSFKEVCTPLIKRKSK